MSAFNRRIEPKEFYGFSAQAVIYACIGLVITVFALFAPLVAKIGMLGAAGACFVWAIYQVRNHKHALLLKAMRLSAKEERCHTRESLNPF